MKHGDFKIGDHFVCGDKRWQVTDVGTRTVLAIPIVDGWTAGPPYGVVELVFDEYDMPGCIRDE